MLTETTGESAALGETLNARLASTFDLPGRIRLLARALSGRIAFSTSLGLEDQAILHAVAESGADVDVFTLDTGRLFPETIDLIEANEQRFKLRIRVIAPSASDIEDLVGRYGIIGFRTSIDARKSCCDIRKIKPLRRGLEGAACWITGLRRSQSSERADVPLAAWDEGYRLLKANPLADWSLERLEAYIATNQVPVNALHARGYPSIGCQPCTRAVLPGEDIRAGRWWWEHEDGKECGLHNRPMAAGGRA